MDTLAILQVGDPGNQYFHRSKTNYPMITQGLPFERNTQFEFVGHSVAAGGIHNNKPIPNIYIYIYIYIYAVLYAYISIYKYILHSWGLWDSNPIHLGTAIFINHSNFFRCWKDVYLAHLQSTWDIPVSKHGDAKPQIAICLIQGDQNTQGIASKRIQDTIEIHGRCPLPAIHGGCTLFWTKHLRAIPFLMSY